MSTPTDPWTSFTFVPGSLPLADAAAIVRESGAGFDPVSLTVLTTGEDDRVVAYDDAAWDALSGADGFSLDSGENHAQPYLQVQGYPTGTEVTVSGVVPPEGLVSALAARPGLLTGASGDFEDAKWQGETDPQHFRMWFSGEWEHLPRTTDKRGRERIDVSGNPGRITRVLGIVLWAAQDTWWGPASALLVDRDAIAGLPVGQVDEVGDNLHVRLWEDGTPLDDVRKAQQVLRDQLRIDEAPAKQEEVRDALTGSSDPDPMFFVQEGTFPHGGVRRFVQYFSASRQPTRRSRAATLVLDEFGPDREQVHHEEVDLTSGPHPDL